MGSIVSSVGFLEELLVCLVRGIPPSLPAAFPWNGTVAWIKNYRAVMASFAVLSSSSRILVSRYCNTRESPEDFPGSVQPPPHLGMECWHISHLVHVGCTCSSSSLVYCGCDSVLASSEQGDLCSCQFSFLGLLKAGSVQQFFKVPSVHSRTSALQQTDRWGAKWPITSAPGPHSGKTVCTDPGHTLNGGPCIPLVNPQCACAGKLNSVCVAFV